MRVSEPSWLPQLFGALPVALLSFDAAGRLHGVNAYSSRLLSIGTELSGNHIDDLAHLVPEEIRSAIGRVLSGQREREDGEAMVAGECACYTVAWAHDRPGEQIVAVIIPCPSRSDKSADFVSIASHALKTPLTAIKGGTQLLTRRISRSPGSVGERDVALLRMISSQVDVLTGMVDSLIETSRLASGHATLSSELLELGELLVGTVQDASRTLPDHPIALDIPSTPALVRVDRQKVDRVLRALLQNAATHSLPGQPISVGLYIADRTPCVMVRDEGTGIPAEEQPRVFEPFYKGSESSTGLGVGLCVAKGLVELHGGRMWLESEPGRGATFYFTLPPA